MKLLERLFGRRIDAENAAENDPDLERMKVKSDATLRAVNRRLPADRRIAVVRAEDMMAGYRAAETRRAGRRG